MLELVQSKAAAGDSEAIKVLSALREIGFCVSQDPYPQQWKQYGEFHYKVLVEMCKKGDLPKDCESPVAYLLSKCYKHRNLKSTGR